MEDELPISTRGRRYSLSPPPLLEETQRASAPRFQRFHSLREAVKSAPTETALLESPPWGACAWHSSPFYKHLTSHHDVGVHDSRRGARTRVAPKMKRCQITVSIIQNACRTAPSCCRVGLHPGSSGKAHGSPRHHPPTPLPVPPKSCALKHFFHAPPR